MSFGHFGGTGSFAQTFAQSRIASPFCATYSCTLSINENADPDVRTDLSQIMNHLVKENEPYYDHTMEGLDDMPAHAKCSLFGVSLTIPITNGRLNLGYMARHLPLRVPRLWR